MSIFDRVERRSIESAASRSGTSNPSAGIPPELGFLVVINVCFRGPF